MPVPRPASSTPSQQIGYALGVAVVGVVFFGALGTDPSPEQYKDAIVAGTSVTIAAFLVAAAAGLALPRRSQGPLGETADTGSESALTRHRYRSRQPGEDNRGCDACLR
jgi:hypothetical protein